jgi:ribosomal RNA-processing protein 17
MNSHQKMTKLADLVKNSEIGRRKKEIKKKQLKEIKWDEENRKEYLTGFRKRKLQRKELAKAKAIERQRQEKIEERKMVRGLVSIINM